MDSKEGTSYSGLKTMQLNDQKAGMEGLDKETINKIIYETSKDTPYFAFQEKRQKSIDSKVNELQLEMKKITDADKKGSLAKMDVLCRSLENERDLSHSIVHIDMDAFYAAVEMHDNPQLKDKPMAVGSMGMLSTSNYHARKYGVRAAMPGFVAKKLCPDLIIVPCNFDKYRAVSKVVRSIVEEYDPHYSAASLDEVYLDLTEYIRTKNRKHLHEEYCMKNDLCDSFVDDENVDNDDIADYANCLRCAEPISYKEQDKMAYVIVEEIREKIVKATELTASAGIAPNTMLAKVGSDQNKPNGQFQVMSTVESVKSFIATLPVKKISGIGPVQGQILNAIGIHTCADMWAHRDLVANLFTPNSVDFYMRAALGIGSTTVRSDYERKSIGNERTFREIHQPEDLHKKCEELCLDLIEDMKSRNLVGKVVVLKIKTTNFQTHTRNHSLSYYTADLEIIYKVAKKLLDAEIAATAPQPLKLRLMGIRMCNLIHKDSSSNSEKQQITLKNFLQSKNVNVAKSLSKVQEAFACPVCLEAFETSFGTFNDHVNNCVNNQNFNDEREIKDKSLSLTESSSIINQTESSDLKSSNITNQTESRDLKSSSINNKTESSGLNSSNINNQPESDDLQSLSIMNRTESCDQRMQASKTCTENVKYFCPVCELNLGINNLVEFNNHIDNCLNRKEIKKILADDSHITAKRKLLHLQKDNPKKSKNSRKEKRIDEYFQ